VNLLIREITETLTQTLKEQLKTVPKANITSDEKEAKAKPPSIAVLNPEFTVEESSLSGSEPERKETHEEKFNGDGRVIEFTLSQQPLRPLSVEHPGGDLRREPDDYTVDYLHSKVSFRTPPEKGKGNVVIRYTGAKSSAELRSLRLNLKYLIEILGEDQSQRDEITLDVLRSLVLAKESLEHQGVTFRILGGRNDNLDHETTSKNSALKTIECLAQTKLTIEMPTGIMEKIFIKQQEPQT
jgi:hypothetical protein